MTSSASNRAKEIYRVDFSFSGIAQAQHGAQAPQCLLVGIMSRMIQTNESLMRDFFSSARVIRVCLASLRGKPKGVRKHRTQNQYDMIRVTLGR